MSLLCINDNEIQLKRRNFKKKQQPLKVVRTQYLVEDKPNPEVEESKIDIEKEEMKVAIQRLIKDKTRLGLQLDQQTLKMKQIISNSGRHQYTQKVDSAIQNLRKAINNFKLNEKSPLYPDRSPSSTLKTPNSSAASIKESQTPHQSVIKQIDFTSRNAYSVLSIALERSSQAFKGALKQVKDVFGKPLTPADRALDRIQEDDEDEPFDFKTRLNINEAAVSVAREAQKLVGVVQHALAYRDVLVEKEEDIDRKVGSLLSQNRSLIEENDEVTSKLMQTRKELSEAKTKINEMIMFKGRREHKEGEDLKLLEGNSDTDTERIMEEMRRNAVDHEPMMRRNEKWPETPVSEVDSGFQGKLANTLGVDQGFFVSNESLHDPSDFIKISDESASGIQEGMVLPNDGESLILQTFPAETASEVEEVKIFERQQTPELRMPDREQLKQKFRQSVKQSKIGLAATNLILQMNQIYEERLTGILARLENMASQINFYANITLKRKEMHLGSSRTSFESDVIDMKPGAKLELERDLKLLERASGKEEGLEESLRASAEMTLKRLLQVAWAVDQHFSAMRREIETRDLSLKEASQMQQYQRRVDSLMNELYFSREMLEEARGEINDLVFGKAAAITGLHGTEARDPSHVLSNLNESLRNIDLKLQQFSSVQSPFNSLKSHGQDLFDSKRGLKYLSGSEGHYEENNSASALTTPLGDTQQLKDEYLRLQEKYAMLNAEYNKLQSAISSPSGGIIELKTPTSFQIQQEEAMQVMSASKTSQGDEGEREVYYEVEKLSSENQELKFTLSSLEERFEKEREEWERAINEKRDQYLKDVRILKEQVRYLKSELESMQGRSERESITPPEDQSANWSVPDSQ